MAIKPKAVSDEPEASRPRLPRGSQPAHLGLRVVVLSEAVVRAERSTSRSPGRGDPTRDKNTEAMIAAYQQANANVKISPPPGEGASYWDQLATRSAGGQAPDIIRST